jgi:NAD(P)-dependent dehydrogenase (short-subunit alcohol dehydrogenase family)
MSDLRQSCIWITGASSGIGEALARQLSAMGNFVIITARNRTSLQQQVLASGGRMSALPLDVTADDGVWAEAGVHLRGITDYLDAVICCAGACEYEDRLDFNPAMYQRVLDVNFLGVVKTLHLAMPLLKKSKKTPCVVAIGSLSSAVPLPRAEAYGASKAALEYFIKSLQTDTGHIPLRAVLVRPGFVATDMTRNNDFSMPFLLSPEKAAAIIIRELGKGRTLIDFPRRLSWSLRLAGLCFGLWRGWAAPRITRIRAENWGKIP